MVLFLVAMSANGSTAVVAAIATVVSSCVAVTAGVLTKRSSDHASVAIAETTTRGQVEEEAFERAKDYYTDRIDRQDADYRDLKARFDKQAEENQGLLARVGTCEASVGDLRRAVEHNRRVAQRLARGVYELRRVLGDKAPRDQLLDEAVIDMLGDGI